MAGLSQESQDELQNTGLRGPISRWLSVAKTGFSRLRKAPVAINIMYATEVYQCS